MEHDAGVFFLVKTQIGAEVQVTVAYWEYLITVKHRVMRGRENIVKSILSSPIEIRRSRTDEDVYLYYGQFDRMYCAVAKQTGAAGFLITAYPADKVKEGDVIWKK